MARAPLLALAALVLAAGCAAREPLPAPLPRIIVDPGPMHVAVPDDGVAVVVRKGLRRLELYRDGSIEKQFPVVFGPRPEGRKRFQGDMRTPEGLYRITQKQEHARWQVFLGIDYPNQYDERSYQRDLSAGLIPVIDGDQVPIGGGLGIHGNDRPEEQVSGRGWTRGCVAMRNADARELYDRVPIGTPILFIP